MSGARSTTDTLNEDAGCGCANPDHISDDIVDAPTRS
jgi:hypothetical protein